MMKHVLLLPFIVFAADASANAEPTEVVVRVISEDAKFIGDSMGGAGIILRDTKSGRVLAKGKTTGGTGNTAMIMQRTGRSPLIATPDAAAFVAQLDIDEPRLVNLEVSGPIDRPSSNVRIVSQRWIMPGESVNIGNGWVVELPGLAISPTARVVESERKSASLTISISAKVELLCGCPITPGGLWDSKDYQVTVSLWQHGRRVRHTALTFVESPGGFAGEIAMPTKGKFRLFVTARNTVTGNSGVTELPRPVK